MSERDEINLRQAERIWQEKQTSSGMMTMALCAAAILGFFYFVSERSMESATVLVVLIAALMAACARMLSCAAKVVEIRTTLQPMRVQSEVIDVEVVEMPRRTEYRKLPRYI
jgi:hypothetical protein